MHKKDYKALAAFAKQFNLTLEACTELAEICAKGNPNFNHERFLVACGRGEQ